MLEVAQLDAVRLELGVRRQIVGIERRVFVVEARDLLACESDLVVALGNGLVGSVQRLMQRPGTLLLHEQPIARVREQSLFLSDFLRQRQVSLVGAPPTDEEYG